MSKTVNLDIPRTAAEREARLRAPMTIPLEEHAVREYGEPANGVCNKCGYCGPVERHGFDQGRHPNCNYAASIVPPPDAASIRESERAACEAIAAEFTYCNAGCIIKARIAARKPKEPSGRDPEKPS